MSVATALAMAPPHTFSEPARPIDSSALSTKESTTSPVAAAVPAPGPSSTVITKAEAEAAAEKARTTRSPNWNFTEKKTLLEQVLIYMPQMTNHEEHWRVISQTLLRKCGRVWEVSQIKQQVRDLKKKYHRILTNAASTRQSEVTLRTSFEFYDLLKVILEKEHVYEQNAKTAPVANAMANAATNTGLQGPKPTPGQAPHRAESPHPPTCTLSIPTGAPRPVGHEVGRRTLYPRRTMGSLPNIFEPHARHGGGYARKYSLGQPTPYARLPYPSYSHVHGHGPRPYGSRPGSSSPVEPRRYRFSATSALSALDIPATRANVPTTTTSPSAHYLPTAPSTSSSTTSSTSSSRRSSMLEPIAPSNGATINCLMPPISSERTGCVGRLPRITEHTMAGASPLPDTPANPSVVADIRARMESALAAQRESAEFHERQKRRADDTAEELRAGLALLCKVHRL
ncbi:hypothetical protein IWQ60_001694 [Tieghemiomyces parasiticus]|uniref:Uncharacterized protein n=1 Tax=Tieghemiomyces parasiticus TaxID=78921 RepID=A0A9W8AE52_9FUNG|nr:hypothetical protein IWQ60_001694 [Tieghemiomyces parasiticus]